MPTPDLVSTLNAENEQDLPKVNAERHAMGLPSQEAEYAIGEEFKQADKSIKLMGLTMASTMVRALPANMALSDGIVKGIASILAIPEVVAAAGGITAGMLSHEVNKTLYNEFGIMPNPINSISATGLVDASTSVLSQLAGQKAMEMGKNIANQWSTPDRQDSIKDQLEGVARGEQGYLGQEVPRDTPSENIQPQEMQSGSYPGQVVEEDNMSGRLPGEMPQSRDRADNITRSEDIDPLTESARKAVAEGKTVEEFVDDSLDSVAQLQRDKPEASRLPVFDISYLWGDILNMCNAGAYFLSFKIPVKIF
jgi:hypothetical protein